MKRYRASNRVPFGGLLLLLIGAVFTAALLGGLLFAVSHLIYLIVLFPLIAGFLGGAIMAAIVRTGKVRSPIIAGLFGLVAGVGIIGVYNFAQYYIDFRNEARNAIIEDSGDDITQQEIDEIIDFVLEDEVGDTGFIGYLKFSAREGTTISRGSSELKLDETATWIYWGAELVVVALIVAGLAFSAARQPFNEEAGEWYPEARRIGSVAWRSRKDFLKMLKSGDTLQAVKLISLEASKPPRLDVLVQQTPSALQTDVILVVRNVKLNRRNEITNDVLKGVLTANEFASFSRSVSEPQALRTGEPSSATPLIT